jgi:hypothetical protein
MTAIQHSRLRFSTRHDWPAGARRAVKRHGHISACRNRIDGAADAVDIREQDIQEVGAEYYHGNPAMRQILLILDILIGGDEYLEPGCLTGGQQIAVRQFGPTHAGGMDDIMTDEKASQTCGDVLVEQDLQAG